MEGHADPEGATEEVVSGQWEGFMEAEGAPGWGSLEKWKWAEPFLLQTSPLWPQPQRAEDPDCSVMVWERGGGGWSTSVASMEWSGTMRATPRRVLSCTVSGRERDWRRSVDLGSNPTLFKCCGERSMG